MNFPLPTTKVGTCIAAILPIAKEPWTEPNYVFVSFGGKQWRGHRLSYRLNVGRVPHPKKVGGGKKFVLHKCGNKWCINHRHLYIGTRSDNINDHLKLHGDEYRAKCSASHKKRFKNNPKANDAMANAALIRWSDPEQIEAAKQLAHRLNKTRIGMRWNKQ